MKTILIVKGTHCRACKALIEDVSHEIPGIQSCVIDYQTGQTEIDHDQSFNFGLFKKEIEVLGDYQVEIKQNSN